MYTEARSPVLKFIELLSWHLTAIDELCTLKAGHFCVHRHFEKPNASLCEHSMFLEISIFGGEGGRNATVFVCLILVMSKI